MRDPYKIEGPAQISFSGGRSSGMMLCKIVEAHGGTLPDDVVVCFANTGKEREETLVFVDRLGKHLGTDIAWIEYCPNGEETRFGATENKRWRAVDFLSASRQGEPFAEIVRRAGNVPTTVGRICTAYLKLKPMHGYMVSKGLPDYHRVIGLRGDEPRRVAKMRARADIDVLLPLADAGAGRADVVAFWRLMPFDLGLPIANGETVGGNCDLCYLKNTNKLLGLIRQEPARTDWWIEQEKRTGKLFRIDRPNYAALKVIAMQPQLDFGEATEDALPCECVD